MTEDLIPSPEPLPEDVELMGLETMRKSNACALGERDFNTVYPDFYNPDKRRRALELFFKEGLTLHDTAKVIGLPVETVAAWAYVGKWVEQKAMTAQVMAKEEMILLSNDRVSKRRGILDGQIKLGEAIREKVSELLVEAETPGQLKALAEAGKLASDTQTRALGVKDDGELGGIASTSSDDPQKQAGKSPLVMVFAGGMPPVRKATVVDERGFEQN